MMSKWINTLSCAGILMMGTSLHGWAKSQNAQMPEQANEMQKPVGFPLSAEQAWFVKETYLIWKPYLDDVDYATRTTTHGTDTTELNMRSKFEKPEFDWFSGVRLGLGRYLSHYDGWDLTFFTTYYYAEETDSTSPEREKGSVINPSWIPSYEAEATQGSVRWLLNYFTWDLSAGRQFSVLDSITAHPYVGLRATLIYKNYGATYSDRLKFDVFDYSRQQKFRSTDNFWGIGPRAGTDFQFNFTGNWSFIGGLSGSLLYGRYDVSEKTSNLFAEEDPFSVSSLQTFKASDERYCVRGNLEGSLGLGWETWVRNQTVRIAPSVVFEASQWFDMNQLFKMQGTSATNPTIGQVVSTRKSGNLALMGFSLNLQVDF